MLTDAIRLLLFPALMAFAASSDLLTMTISNRLSLALAGGFAILAVASGMSLAAIGMHIGAAALVPVWTAHTQPERFNRERLRALAIAAAEQSERLSVPEVHAPERLDKLLAGWPAQRRLIVCDETGAGMPIGAALETLSDTTSAALLVGPEGGFTETELDALGKLPIVSRVGLGPRVLRAETAAIAALAVFQAIAGDWRRARPR